MQPGKNLERLVAALERVLAGSEATVEAPSRRLIDRDTGRRREHDVLITRDHGHYKTLTALECRDRNRPVGVPDVEAFADKCQATGVSLGIIVSASGFRESARQKAASRSITCMDLEEAESFDWLAIDSVSVHHRRFPHIDVRVMFKDFHPQAMAAIFDGDGTLLPQEVIVQYVKDHLDEYVDPEGAMDGPIPVEMNIVTKGWSARDAEGKCWPISHLNVRTTYTPETESIPLTLHRYEGVNGQYAVATASANLNGTAGKFVMMKKGPDDGPAIYWVPDKPSGSE